MSRWIEERESDGFFDVLDDGGGAVGVVASCLSYADAKSLIDGPDLLARAEKAEATLALAMDRHGKAIVALGKIQGFIGGLEADGRLTTELEQIREWADEALPQDRPEGER